MSTEYDVNEVYAQAQARWPRVDTTRTRLVLERKPETFWEAQRQQAEARQPLPEGASIHHVTVAAEKLGDYWLGYSDALDCLVLWVGYTDEEMTRHDEDLGWRKDAR